MAANDTAQARLQAAKEINAPPTLLLTLAAEVAQVLDAAASVDKPPLSVIPRPLPPPVAQADSLATGEPHPKGISDADLDRWLSQLNCSAPGAPGMVEEGDTEDEDAVEQDLSSSRLLQTLQGQACNMQSSSTEGANIDNAEKGKRKRKSAKNADKGKGKVSAELSKPQFAHSNENEDDPETHSAMTLVDWDPADTVAATGITQERDILQLPVNDIRRALIQFIIQPVLDERAEQEQFIVSVTVSFLTMLLMRVSE
jgi:hypothetical protein